MLHFPPVVVILNVHKYSLCPQHMSEMHLPADLKLGKAMGLVLANEI